MGEDTFIRWLQDHLAGHPDERLGIGDDAAILDWKESDNVVVTTDLLADGVHFQLEKDEVELIGRKALAVNLSDLAAMAAVPIAAVVALILPRQGGQRLARRLYDGMLPLAQQFDVTISGGDTNSWNGQLVIAITLFGKTTERGPLTRGGASPGDAVLVTGHLGGSLTGEHLSFQPRVREAIRLHNGYELNAGMDISDGLLLDLSRMATASGCGAELQLDTIPISEAARRQQATDHRSALAHALEDGEDFELLLATSQETADQLLLEQPLGVPIAQVGSFVERIGLTGIDGDGKRVTLEPTGYQHALEE